MFLDCMLLYSSSTFELRRAYYAVQRGGLIEFSPCHTQVQRNVLPLLECRHKVAIVDDWEFQEQNYLLRVLTCCRCGLRLLLPRGHGCKQLKAIPRIEPAVGGQNRFHEFQIKNNPAWSGVRTHEAKPHQSLSLTPLTTRESMLNAPYQARTGDLQLIRLMR